MRKVKKQWGINKTGPLMERPAVAWRLYIRAASRIQVALRQNRQNFTELSADPARLAWVLVFKARALA
jgi:hypothetical protein